MTSASPPWPLIEGVFDDPSQCVLTFFSASVAAASLMLGLSRKDERRVYNLSKLKVDVVLSKR